MLALPISMQRFKSIIFYQNNPKIKLFLQQNAKFSSFGGYAPRPLCLPGAGGFALSLRPLASKRQKHHN